MVDLQQTIEERLGPPAVEDRAAGLQAEIDRRLAGEPEAGMAGLVGQQELGPPGLEDFRARFTVAEADTLKEKIIAFKSTFPEGDLERDPVDGTLLFRENASQPFAKVDADLTEKFEPLGDLIDFIAPDIGAISGEVLAAIRSRGISLLGLMTRLFVGATAGDVAQQEVQGLRGIQQETREQSFQRSTTKGMFAAGGGAVGTALGTAVNVVRGAGSGGLRPGAEKAMRAAERQDIPGLMPIQVSDSPIIRKLGGQAGAVMPRIARRAAEQEVAIKARLALLRDRTETPKLGQRLLDLHTAVRKDTLSKLEGVTKRTEGNVAGRDLAQGIAEYDIKAQAIIDEAYDAARALETPQFDGLPIRSAIDDLEIGQPFQGPSKAPAFAKEHGVTPDEFKQLFGEDPLKRDIFQSAENVQKGVQDVSGLLKKMDFTAPDLIIDGKRFTTTDALLRLRRRLWDLKTPNPGELARLEHGQAQQLYSAITDVIDNPINTNALFVRAWQNARKVAADRFDTWEKLIVMRVAKDETPAQLASRLAQPRQIDNLEALRAVVPTERFASLQNFFKSELLRDSDNIAQRLGQFDKPTLDILLSPAEQGLFRRVGEQIDNLNRVGIDKILKRQERHGAIIGEAIERGDTAQVAELFKMVQFAGGKSSDVGRSVRAGIIENVWRDVQRLPKGEGEERIVRTLLNSKIAELRDAGALRFLKPGDIKTLRDLRLIKSFLEEGADAGTSIQASEAVAGLRSFGAAAFQTLLEHIGMGRLMTSKFGQRLLVGRGKTKAPMTALKFTSAALATAISDVEAETKRENSR